MGEGGVVGEGGGGGEGEGAGEGGAGEGVGVAAPTRTEPTKGTAPMIEGKGGGRPFTIP